MSGDGRQALLPVLEPGVTWTFAATARGANYIRDRKSDFTIDVHGHFVVLDDELSITSTHGSCITPFSRDVESGREDGPARFGRTCDDLRFSVVDDGQSLAVSISVQFEETRQRKGKCLEWATDSSTGRRLQCIEYDWIETRRDTWTPAVRAQLSRM